MVEVQAPIHINRKSRYRNALKTRPNKVRSVLPVKERLLSLKKVNLFSAALNSRRKGRSGLLQHAGEALGQQKVRAYQTTEETSKQRPPQAERYRKTTVFERLEKTDCSCLQQAA